MDTHSVHTSNPLEATDAAVDETRLEGLRIDVQSGHYDISVSELAARIIEAHTRA